MAERKPNPKLMTDPPGFLRKVSSLVFSRLVDSSNIARKRQKIEEDRKRKGQSHLVEYFHQFDDPYSHLASQVLPALQSEYNIELKVHMINAAGRVDQPEPKQLAMWAHTDSHLIAQPLGLKFSGEWPIQPNTTDVELGEQILGSLGDSDRIDRLAHISSLVWQGNTEELQAIVKREIPSTKETSANEKDESTKRIKRLGHYSGATFYYGGEWYWGVDRLYHLEQRLMELEARNSEDIDFIVPRKETDLTNIDASQLQLDFYCSLNSPYSAIVFDKVIELKNQINCQFNLKPVLPMVMRGIPASRRKATYIMLDAKRESVNHDATFGPLTPPIGSPTRQAYALMSSLDDDVQREKLLSSLFHEAFSKATRLNTQKGMKVAVESAGISWADVKDRLNSSDWEAVQSQNQAELSDELQLWGVPSFRLRGPTNEPELVLWGQDRLWLLKSEIKRRVELTTS